MAKRDLDYLKKKYGKLGWSGTNYQELVTTKKAQEMPIFDEEQVFQEPEPEKFEFMDNGRGGFIRKGFEHLV